MSIDKREEDNYSTSDFSSEVSEKKTFVGIIDRATDFIKELFALYTEHVKFYKFEVHRFTDICQYLTPKSRNFFKPLYKDEETDLQIYSWMFDYAKNGKKIYLYVVYNPHTQHETPPCDSFYKNIIDEKDKLVEEINLLGSGLTFLYKGTESGLDKSVLNEIKKTFRKVKITPESIKQLRFKKILEIKQLINSYISIVVDNFQIFKNFEEARTFAQIGSEVEIPNLSELLAAHYPERDFTLLKAAEQSKLPLPKVVRSDGKKTFADVVGENIEIPEIQVIDSTDDRPDDSSHQIEKKTPFLDALNKDVKVTIEESPINQGTLLSLAIVKFLEDRNTPKDVIDGLLNSILNK